MDGILLFDKPLGWTSHDAVDFVRKCVRQKKVGHAGTLDPLATGLLVILLGQTTKLSQRLSDHDKEYRGVMRLGLATDTQDMEGKVVTRGDSSGITREAVQKFSIHFWAKACRLRRLIRPSRKTAKNSMNGRAAARPAPPSREAYASRASKRWISVFPMCGLRWFALKALMCVRCARTQGKSLTARPYSFL